MTEKQKHFCIEYLIDLNATQAAIRAGYSKKTAKVIGQENLTKPDIKKYIEQQLKQIKNEKIADVQEVLEYLTAVMRGEQKEQVALFTGKACRNWCKKMFQQKTGSKLLNS